MIAPSVGCSNPAISRSSALFPQPDGPTTSPVDGEQAPFSGALLSREIALSYLALEFAGNLCDEPDVPRGPEGR
ncbi:hypothetical protein ACWD0A_24410 [Streptomyces sp. NPDC002867]